MTVGLCFNALLVISLNKWQKRPILGEKVSKEVACDYSYQTKHLQTISRFVAVHLKLLRTPDHSKKEKQMLLSCWAIMLSLVAHLEKQHFLICSFSLSSQIHIKKKKKKEKKENAEIQLANDTYLQILNRDVIKCYSPNHFPPPPLHTHTQHTQNWTLNIRG